MAPRRAAPRPLTAAEIGRQLPAQTPRHDPNLENFDHREAYVRRYFGPAAHLLTVTTARRTCRSRSAR